MKIALLVATLLVLIVSSYVLFENMSSPAVVTNRTPTSTRKITVVSEASKSSEGAVVSTSAHVSKTTGASPAMTREEELAAHREIDKAHMREIYKGLFAYKAKHGHFPEFLSQLTPEFISPKALISPRSGDTVARHFLDNDHPDPQRKPAYGFEFSNLEFRDGRTFADIKEVQRSEWGDVVPLLRAFGYDGHVINMAYSGDFYETRLNWEWDAATLDLVDKLGWGPGLNVGDTVKVQVFGEDGQPVSNAHVWADGRNYSFDLPDRPFITDAEGYVSIPIGVDTDRTELALRAEAPGLAAQAIRLERGDVGAQTLTLSPSSTVSGVALNRDGQPAVGRRIILKTPGDGYTNQTLAQVITGADGRWRASLHPSQAQAFNAFIAQPGGIEVKFNSGIPVDVNAAFRGIAIIREP